MSIKHIRLFGKYDNEQIQMFLLSQKTGERSLASYFLSFSKQIDVFICIIFFFLRLISALTLDRQTVENFCQMLSLFLMTVVTSC